MMMWKKAVIAFALVFAVAGAPSMVWAGCGSCGGDAGHKHAKPTCVKCDHAKVCTSEDCTDVAHQAECTCPKKEEQSQEG